MSIVTTSARRRPGAWCTLLLAWAAANPLRGEGAREFLIQNWTREHGIPGTTVTAVSQTPDGYLWLGTFAGLARFDGVRFVTLDLRQKAGVPDTSVTCLSTDRQGNLWIGTSDGHLIRMQQDTFTTCLPPSRRTADRYLQRISEDESGAIWALNYEGGLSRQTGNTFQEFTESSGILALVTGTDGIVWVASPNHLLTSTQGRLQPVWSPAQEPGFLPKALAPARNGGCWVAGNGQVRLFKDGRPHEVRAAIEGKEAAVLGFLEDREGSLWLGTYGEGVIVLDPGGGVKRLAREQGLPSNLVRCLFEDREGNLWAGMEGRGLARIRRAMFASYGRTEGMSDETVLCACEGRDGDVWIGTNGDGVYRIHQKQIQHFGVNEGLTNQFVWSLRMDRIGSVWAGTWGGGLFRFENAGFLNTSPEFGPAPVVLALHEDQQGTLWLGQRTGPERTIEAIERGQRRTLTVPGELPRVEVRSIAETDDSLWFGTIEEGLLSWKDGRFRHYGTNNGLPPGGIGTLHVDDDGALWLAVADVGLVLRHGERFAPVKTTPELFERNINQITDDGLGYLWCGTRSGVVRVKKADLRRCAQGENPPVEWRRFSKADGLPSNVCSGGGFRASDGRLWFPTLMGMAVVNPRHLTPASPPPKVLIEEAFLPGKRVYERSPAMGDASASLRISPGAGPLDISYTALSFAAPDRVQFRYQLAGLDDEPVEAGNARVARYNRLPPGQYQFQVAARTEGGEWSEPAAGLAIEMLPHYWQTSWFQILVFAAVLGTTASIARVVILRRVERRLANLERQRALEAERSRISQDLHDDLGTSLMEIKFLSTVAGSPSSSPAEVKTHLADINNKSLELVKALDEIVWAVNPKNDSLRNLVNYLCLFAQEFLSAASIQCRLDVPRGLPDLPLNAEQRHTLFLVTKEALANAAKHSAATEVWLRVALAGSNLALVIEDNGRGFEATTLKTDRNGLKNIEKRMHDLGGRARIHSAPDRGARIGLELPLR